MVFKWNEDFTSLVLNILQNGEWVWNVKFENSRQKNRARQCKASTFID
jgi:hypothetical protein